MKKSLYSILLVLSVLLNIIFIFKYVDNAKTLNTTWYRLTSQFSNSIQSSIENPVTDIKTVASTYQNLKGLQREYFNLQFLPKGNLIITNNTLQRFESLLQYQFDTLEMIKKEINTDGKISDTTKNRYQKSNQNWSIIAKSLNNQLKTIDPFPPVFSWEKWKKVFDTAAKPI
jgi:hypothetical protein